MLMVSYGNIGIVAFLEINLYVNFVLSMQHGLNIILKLNMLKGKASGYLQPIINFHPHQFSILAGAGLADVGRSQVFFTGFFMKIVVYTTQNSPLTPHSIHGLPFLSVKIKIGGILKIPNRTNIVLFIMLVFRKGITAIKMIKNRLVAVIPSFAPIDIRLKIAFCVFVQLFMHDF